MTRAEAEKIALKLYSDLEEEICSQHDHCVDLILQVLLETDRKAREEQKIKDAGIAKSYIHVEPRATMINLVEDYWLPKDQRPYISKAILNQEVQNDG